MLVIPETIFTLTSSNTGYLGIKRMVDKGKFNYSSFSAIQASDLKERLEEMKINRDKVTIVLVDAINMYMYIKLLTIKNQ